MKPYSSALTLILALAGCANWPATPPSDFPGVGEYSNERWHELALPDLITTPNDNPASAELRLPENSNGAVQIDLPTADTAPKGETSMAWVRSKVEEMPLPVEQRLAQKINAAPAAEEPLPALMHEPVDATLLDNTQPADVTPSATKDLSITSASEAPSDNVALVMASQQPDSARATSEAIGLMDVVARPAEKALLAGWRAYDNAQYDKAEEHLASALDIGLISSRDRSSARKLLAFIYCTSQRTNMCESAFLAARQADPDFALSRSEAGHPLWGPVYKRVLP